MTGTPPSGTGDQVNAVGIPYHADKIQFNTSNVLVEIT